MQRASKEEQPLATKKTTHQDEGNKQSMNAAITGATSGIGRAFAERLAHDGYSLLLSARNKQRLLDLADTLHAEAGVAIEVLAADLSTPDGRKTVCDRFAKDPSPDVLVNNAGFGLPGRFMDQTAENHRTMIAVHVDATTELTHAALPHMLSQGRGVIINVASLAAQIPLPGSSTYCATKSYIVRFTQALSAEVAAKGVALQALCPGLTRTDFHDRMKDDRINRTSTGLLRWMEADEVVTSSLRCLGRANVVHVPGFSNRLSLFLYRLIPDGLFSRLSRRVA